mmetsp:Transcript_2210/g.2295  ORF Transcript_2210/g.2295 Transcript_2210/m.2295 type:complete len:227 (+) Transcript_2210:20-700(+)
MGKLKLITNPVSPFNSRVLIALAFKGIDYDIEYYDHTRDHETHKKINPLGKVPVLVLEDDTIIYESMAIIELLDSLPQYAETPKLFPADPVEKAKVYMKIARLDVLNTRLGPYIRSGAEEGLKGIEQGIKIFEEIIGEANFFGGDNLGIVDANFFPFMDRMYQISEFKEKFEASTKISGWYERMINHPAVVKGFGRVEDDWWPISMLNFRGGKNPVAWPVRDLNKE